MSSRPDMHIRASFFTLHYDIFHLDIISSLFSDITYHHLWYSFSVFSFIIDYSPLSLFHLEWWFFTRHYMEDCHILHTRSPCEQWFRDLILRGCLVSEDSCYISTWGVFIRLAMYFMGDHSLLIRLCTKKNALFIISFFIGHVYGCAKLLHWVHVLKRVRMRASLWDSILVHVLGDSMSRPFDFCERGKRPFFSISGSLLYPSPHLFWMWLLPWFDAG